MSEVLRDLVVSLSLDSDNFSRNLTSINKQIQEAESRFKMAASGVANFEKSAAGARAELDTLAQKLSLQQKAVTQYERALEAANKKLETAHARQGKLSASLSEASARNADLKAKVAAATTQYETFRRKLGDTDSATIAAKANLDALSEEFRESGKEVKKLEGQLAANTKSLQNNADAVTKARTGLNQAQAALKQTEAQIKAATDRLARMQSAWTKTGETLTAFGAKCAAVSTALSKVGKGMTAALTTPVLALGTAAIKASIDFESAFTGVRKTVDATEHYIHRNVVEEAVLANLQAVTSMAKDHEAEFVRTVQRKSRASNQDVLRRSKKEQATIQKRLEEIDRIINGLFESKVSGELSAERFTRMLVTYEDEQAKLRERNGELLELIAVEQEASDVVNQFVSLVRQFTDIQVLTPEIVAAFIEKVYVHDAVVVDGRKQQEIRVVYNFIGDMK